MSKSTIVSLAGIALIAGTASAQITVTQSNAPAPTYTTTLNFDEVGGPTGALPSNAFSSYGISEMFGGDGDVNVGDADTLVGGWGLGTGNVVGNYWGVTIKFSSAVTEFSCQAWDPSGPPSFFGGGLAIYVLSGQIDGVQDNVVFGDAYTPAWGGVGDTWFNITTTGGATFDELRIFGNGFNHDTYLDNLSWNAVPTPASAALLGFGGLVATRRRR